MHHAEACETLYVRARGRVEVCDKEQLTCDEARADLVRAERLSRDATRAQEGRKKEPTPARGRRERDLEAKGSPPTR